MLKFATAAAAAALIAAALVVLPGASPDVAASTVIPSAAASIPVAAAPEAPAAKADRVEIAATSTCTQRGWPYYDRDCIRAPSAGPAPRPVRVIALDRVPASELR